MDKYTLDRRFIEAHPEFHRNDHSSASDGQRDRTMDEVAKEFGKPRDLNREVNAILKSLEIVKRYNDLGAEMLVGSPEDFAKYLEVETRKWGEVVRFSGAKID